MPGEGKHLQAGQEMGERRPRYISLTTLSLLRLVSNALFTHISMMIFYLPCSWLSSAWQQNQALQDQIRIHFTSLHAQAKHWPQGIRTLCFKPIPPQCNYALQQQDWRNEIFKILLYQCLSSCCSNKQFCTEPLSVTVGDAWTPWVIHPSFQKIYIKIFSRTY